MSHSPLALMMLLIHSSTVNFTEPLNLPPPPTHTPESHSTRKLAQIEGNVMSRGPLRSSADFTEMRDRSESMVTNNHQLNLSVYLADFILSQILWFITTFILFAWLDQQPKSKIHLTDHDRNKDNQPVLTFGKLEPTNV